MVRLRKDGTTCKPVISSQCRDHSDTVVTHSPAASEIGVSKSWPDFRKPGSWSAVYITEP